MNNPFYGDITGDILLQLDVDLLELSMSPSAECSGTVSNEDWRRLLRCHVLYPLIVELTLACKDANTKPACPIASNLPDASRNPPALPISSMDPGDWAKIWLQSRTEAIDMFSMSHQTPIDVEVTKCLVQALASLTSRIREAYATNRTVAVQVNKIVEDSMRVRENRIKGVIHATSTEFSEKLEKFSIVSSVRLHIADEDLGLSDEHSIICVGKIQRSLRQKFSKPVTDILEAWLLAHLNNPYPTAQDKVWLMENTGLSFQRLNQWFVNVRRRRDGVESRKKSPKN